MEDEQGEHIGIDLVHHLGLYVNNVADGHGLYIEVEDELGAHSGLKLVNYLGLHVDNVADGHGLQIDDPRD